MATKLQDVLAQAFAAEGCEVLFTLMGDANMYWTEAMARQPGITVVNARHEHCAVAMADGYARATGKVGVASTTCGPGFTQIMTALAIAARASVPLVVFAGDSPMLASYYVQQIDMAPLAQACGAHYIAVKSLDRALDNVREAFHTAALERRPVVLSVPMDLQKQAYPYLADYIPSSDYMPMPQRSLPDPAMVDRLVAMIEAAEKPIVIAGRGARLAKARAPIEAMAERCGALLATSLQAKGLFEGSPWTLDIAGAFASDFSRELFAGADLVIGIGVGLGAYTTESGYLYPNAQTVQIDINPRGLWQGLRTADLHIRADAFGGAEAIAEALAKRGITKPGWRNAALAAQIAEDRPDRKEFAIAPGTVDPRQAMLELDAIVPKDWDVVIGGGHYLGIAMTHLRGRAPERINVVCDFGAIGNGLPAAIGVAAARRDGKVLLIEGDGSLLMHVQELETIRREGHRLLMAIINDGGYGAEIHKFRAGGLDPSLVIHGRGDLAGAATGFGVRGGTVTGLGAMAGMFAQHQASNGASLWDIHTDDTVVSRPYRRVHYGEA
ncbi:thiamine pyrophosphate-binding protein [Paracraurococcus lichenis]|uniref:Thiamine pyrophosphate-binding protein n=1 Tax=Paracraurococcus lichenis TaxID=3064888 RepID=A0ABT9DY60_9PROT|nr:thiamine pyrophosphate-binding protein [Paracraurococcus sp. LOR1-02]MDO9708838.1 thiamine pyrophosphate-binding protein [Paracraurococcus sp. LOR1-02]